MSYSFGWWDFIEIDGEPQMVCRDSDERVVMVRDLEEPWLAKAIAEHPKRPADRWKRFEYRHEEFWFPLIVNWMPEEGRILVDYNLSSELWRQETNADTEYPPYGGWVRVDDMVPDAFWSWKNFNSEKTEIFQIINEFSKIENGLYLVGGYLQGEWIPELQIKEHTYQIPTPRFNKYYNDNESSFKREFAYPINMSSLGSWKFHCGTAFEANTIMKNKGSALELSCLLQYEEYDDPIPYPSLEGGRYCFLIGENHNFVIQMLYNDPNGYTGATYYRFWDADSSFVEIAVDQKDFSDNALLKSFSTGSKKYVWLGEKFLPFEEAFNELDLSLSYCNWIRREISQAWFSWKPLKSAIFENTAKDMDVRNDHIDDFSEKFYDLSEPGEKVSATYTLLRERAGISTLSRYRLFYLNNFNISEKLVGNS